MRQATRRGPIGYIAPESMTEEESWDSCVAQLLGPRALNDDGKQRTANALQLAAAALRAAGECELANGLLN